MRLCIPTVIIREFEVRKHQIVGRQEVKTSFSHKSAVAFLGAPRLTYTTVCVLSAYYLKTPSPDIRPENCGIHAAVNKH